MTTVGDPAQHTSPPAAPGALVLGAQTAIPEHVLQAALAFWREQRRIQWWQVTGRSMQPLLREGDELQVQHCSQALRPGDIAVFRLRGQWVAHRVVRIVGVFPHRWVTARGDNAAGDDPAIQEDAVAGRALALRRGADTIRLDTRMWRIYGLAFVARARFGAGLRRVWRRA